VRDKKIKELWRKAIPLFGRKLSFAEKHLLDKKISHNVVWVQVLDEFAVWYPVVVMVWAALVKTYFSKVTKSGLKWILARFHYLLKCVSQWCNQKCSESMARLILMWKRNYFLHESSRQFFVNFAVVEIQNANYFFIYIISLSYTRPKLYKAISRPQNKKM